VHGSARMQCSSPDDHGVIMGNILAVGGQLVRARLFHRHTEVDVLGESDLLVKKRGPTNGAELSALVCQASEHACRSLCGITDGAALKRDLIAANYHASTGVGLKSMN